MVGLFACGCPPALASARLGHRSRTVGRVRAVVPFAYNFDRCCDATVTYDETRHQQSGDQEAERMATPQQPEIPQISPEQAQTRQQAGATLVDVREADEWGEEHIAGARHIPLGQIQQRAGELDPNAELIMVCRSGRRSQSAALALHRAGFTNVSNMAGGMLAWEEKKLPVE